MTKTEILLTMHAKEPLRTFRAMQLGGSNKTLAKMEDEGLISSESRYGGRHRQRNYYLTEAQHAALGYLFTDGVHQ